MFDNLRDQIHLSTKKNQTNFTANRQPSLPLRHAEEEMLAFPGNDRPTEISPLADAHVHGVCDGHAGDVCAGENGDFLENNNRIR